MARKQEGRGGVMANKTKGAVILFGTDSAKGTSKLLDMILTAVRAVACPRESWRLIMDCARSIAGGDLGRLLNRRTIATPSRGVFSFLGGCLTLLASLRPHSVRGAADGNPSGLMFPVDILPTRRRPFTILADGAAFQTTQSTGV